MQVLIVEDDRNLRGFLRKACPPSPLSSTLVRPAPAAGPFSAAPGNLEAGPPFPGSDFVAMNGNAIPPGLQLRFDFNGDDDIQGDSQWMHVISIEPSFDQGEGTLNATPFLLKPFGNAFGDGGPTDARTITALVPLPTGTATITTSSN